MQLNITLQLTEKELSTIEEALFISSMQLYDVQYKTNDPEDVEEYNKMVNIYEKLTGNDCRHLLANFIMGEKLIMNELEIKLNCLYKLMEELNIQKRYNDAATVYWAIAQLEQHFKVKVK